MDISREKTVDKLKKAIVAKKPNRFQGIDAKSLDLWLKNIPTKDKTKLRPLNLKNEDILDETWKIGRYFTGDPTEGRVHIVVRPPGK